MKRAGTIWKWAAVLLLLLLVLPCTAGAQDFYGEGNVLIAVDMAPYAENEAVSYPEGTLGTLVWGEGAEPGENTCPAFDNHHYEVSPEVVPVPAKPYDPEVAYSVDQTVLFP